MVNRKWSDAHRIQFKTNGSWKTQTIENKASAFKKNKDLQLGVYNLGLSKIIHLLKLFEDIDK